MIKYLCFFAFVSQVILLSGQAAAEQKDNGWNFLLQKDFELEGIPLELPPPPSALTIENGKVSTSEIPENSWHKYAIQNLWINQNLRKFYNETYSQYGQNLPFAKKLELEIRRAHLSGLGLARLEADDAKNRIKIAEADVNAAQGRLQACDNKRDEQAAPEFGWSPRGILLRAGIYALLARGIVKYWYQDASGVDMIIQKFGVTSAIAAFLAPSYWLGENDGQDDECNRSAIFGHLDFLKHEERSARDYARSAHQIKRERLDHLCTLLDLYFYSNSVSARDRSVVDSIFDYYQHQCQSCDA